ncbi:MAG: ATP-dependent RNA helicase [Proteobacteria bacterium]|nr:ATP-dependent RNA helicase [Pseudomonadota bacterium]
MSEITQLPIYKHQEEISKALEQHQVIVVQGPTGCGKTTQLPRILLRNPKITGRIGLTQPRRIAAVSVADRISHEIGCELGTIVGYAIRFDDKTSDDTIVKVMTDGILLQESRSDHLYSQYQVIIIDEAHERSLNIDLALGLLREAIDKREDLRVIISSATIRAETFQKYFSRTGDGSDVPLISIQSRTYPVDIQYRDVETSDHNAMPEALIEEVKRIHKSGEQGHILCFLPGQGTILSCQEALQTIQATEKGFSDLWVLPLYGALSRADQEKVFEEAPGKRKVVLATNIAETSITIPDVRFVIDSGIAKIPRFNPRTNVTTLREEGVSHASLAQRAGRAGRTAPGQCIRLFPESLLDRRTEYTDEEITRLDLSEVILRLIDIGIREVETFPFPTRPPRQGIRDALAELVHLGAIDKDNTLTQIGQKMVAFPLSPRLARIVIEAGMRYPDVMHEIIMAVAWLSVKSPLLYPPNHENQARNAHAKLSHPLGDLLTGISITKKYQDAEDKKQFCYKNFLDPDTMAFIVKSTEQIEELAETVGFVSSSGGNENDIIKAFLVAYGDQCLVLKGRSYITPADINVVLHPSSSLYQAMPKIIVALEFIQSTRIYAEQASVVRAAWLKEYGIQLNLSDDAPRPGHKGYQEFSADRKKIKRFERTRAALGYDETSMPTKPVFSNGRKLFRPETVARVEPHRAEVRSTRRETRDNAAQDIVLAGRQLRVTIVRRQPLVVLTLDDLRAMAAAPALEIKKDIAAYRASVRDNSGKNILLNNYKLGEIIDVARVLEMLNDKCIVPDNIPIGASLSAQQNIKVLLKALPFIGMLHTGARGKSGWLTLTCAEEIFWFEFNDQPMDALELSMSAFEVISEYVHDANALQQFAQTQQKLASKITKIKKIVTAALDKH